MKKVTPQAVKSVDLCAPAVVHLKDGRRASIVGFDPFVAIWVYVLRQLGCAENSILMYFHDLQRLFATVGEVANRAFEAACIDEIAEWLPEAYRRIEAECSNDAVCRRTATALRQFCYLLHLRFSIPCDRLLTAKQPHPVFQERFVPRAEDFEAVVAFIGAQEGWDKRRDVCALKLVQAALLGLSEILDLNIGHVDALARTLLVKRKRNGKEIWTRIADPEFWTLLNQYIELCPFEFRSDGPLFMNSEGGRLAVRQLQETLQITRCRLGIDGSLNAQSVKLAHALSLRQRGMTDLEMIEMTGWHQTLHLAKHVSRAPMNGLLLSQAIEKARRELIPSPDLAAMNAGIGEGESRFIDRVPEIRRLTAPKLFCDQDVESFTSKMPHYDTLLRNFEDYLATLGATARCATSAIIIEYLNLRAREGRKNTTILALHSALVTFYRDMFERKIISSNPMLHVVRPPNNRSTPKAVSPDVVRLWITRIEHAIDVRRQPIGLFIRGAAIVALTASEGLKTGQLRSLRASDAERCFGPGSIASGYTQKAIERLARFAAGNEFLLHSPVDGTPLSRQHLSVLLGQIGEELGLPPVCARDLTNAFRRGVLRALPDVYLLGAIAGSQVWRLGYEPEPRELIDADEGAAPGGTAQLELEFAS